jgi:hypothetical protein
MFDSDFQFSVELWSDDDARLEETIAKARILLIGRGAFKAAVDTYPTRRILLRHGTRVVDRHPRAAEDAHAASGLFMFGGLSLIEPSTLNEYRYIAAIVLLGPWVACCWYTSRCERATERDS